MTTPTDPPTRIDAVAGQPFVARVTAFPTGLQGTVAYRIIAADETVVVARTTTGVTEDADEPGDYTVTAALAEPGDYRIVWDFGSDVTAQEDIQVLALDYSPSVDQVGALLRTRTTERGSSGEAGTFTENTRPTHDEVVDLIDLATRDVQIKLGTTIPAALVQDARQTIALRAAMLVELSFYGDQISVSRSPYTELKALYKEALDALVSAKKDLGADQQPGTPDDLSDAGLPSWSFPSLSADPHVPGSELPVTTDPATAWMDW